jgi:hypothetical protein
MPSIPRFNSGRQRRARPSTAQEFSLEGRVVNLTSVPWLRLNRGLGAAMSPPPPSINRCDPGVTTNPGRRGDLPGVTRHSTT